jgi:CDP-4-dehydro-6-deoxyglucose reductase/ferredoxin-NAD(P)+ reductase (naphthalene dioxygenase ferredoxin-specific)
MNVGGNNPVTLAASRPLYGRVVQLIDATPEIRIVRLQVVHGGAFRFRAGQYARVTFGTCRPRDYSLANRPDDPILEFHVRHEGGGGASAHVARTLREGDGVWVDGPFGDAWWRPEHDGPVLAVAGGTGLAPIRSIVETALGLGFRNVMHIYIGARRERDIYLEDHFRMLVRRHPSVRLHVLLSDPGVPPHRRRGTLVDAIEADVQAIAGLKAYLAGPPAMIGALTSALTAKGLSPDDIHADRPHPLAAAAVRSAG